MEENNGQSKFKKYLFNEGALIFGIVGVVLSGFIYLTYPQKANDTSIQLLQAQVNTQETTIETLTKTQQNDVKELNLTISRVEERQIEMLKEVVELKTLMRTLIDKK